MDERETAERVRRIKEEISSGNLFGEKVTLVAAIKTQTPEAVNAAIAAGVDAVAENKVQEFREKNASLLPCPRHFIGHLQTNKVKYLLGEISLFHSCDRDELAAELSRLSVRRGLVSRVLVQVNIGREASKGGYAPEEAEEAVVRLRETPGLKVCGLMAMLPESEDEGMLGALADQMRALYEAAGKNDPDFVHLSMGMSGDYRLCIAHGSNMIRLGSTIFGARDYSR